jgi:hypothetical protein
LSSFYLAGTCASGWIPSDSSCYLVSSNAEDHGTAKKICEDSEAHLVYIETAKEAAFLKNEIV